MIQPHAPPLTVLGSWLSPCVRRVLAALEFKGLRYVVDPIVPLYGNDDFVRLNPALRIPALIDDGFVVPDSRHPQQVIRHFTKETPSCSIT